eukprot:9044648-Alexandrium_andersonii.AAC.1
MAPQRLALKCSGHADTSEQPAHTTRAHPSMTTTLRYSPVHVEALTSLLDALTLRSCEPILNNLVTRDLHRNPNFTLCGKLTICVGGFQA